MSGKHQAKKIEEGTYEYRGYTIRRNEGVSDGYFGRWSTGGFRNGMASDTLKGVKSQIDYRLDSKKGN